MIPAVRAALAALAVVVSPVAAAAQSSLPDMAVTPGAVNPDVDQSNIGSTICVRGWTRTVRPPARYTRELKWQQINEYGYVDTNPADYEEDHLIPLALGGSPTDPRNLWPEPRHPADGWTADKKDELEVRLVRLVCAGRVPLEVAQRAIAEDWHAAYRRFVRQG